MICSWNSHLCILHITPIQNAVMKHHTMEYNKLKPICLFVFLPQYKEQAVAVNKTTAIFKNNTNTFRY